MREIKFRAFEKSLGMTLPVDAIDFCENYVVVHIEDNYMEWYLNEAILEQCTGLKDVNGVDIYEGDIVKAFHNYIDTVIFRIGCFGFDANYNHPFTPLCNLDGSMEVIGNVHQNPELLEE
ncbi:YopX family protein [Lentilactobacillus senioris]|uniref:YopX family protein n=1 Tax=Lentilactobacillus senioris TaxID=931534 RepID=UPI0022807A44|nr:YopX family protein [Lentilactobacillus senioris]MCY9807056.1 YopX family protein [Lentilactobacillus senioris]